MDIFFKGKVIDKQTTEGNIWTSTYEYTFEIHELIKGEYDQNTIKISSSTQGSACGVNYEIGEDLYIFSYEHEGNYNTGLCCLNQRVAYNNDSILNLIEEYKNEATTEWCDIFGNIVAEGKIKDGIPVGYWRIYGEIDRNQEQGNYTNGLRNGIWKYYLVDKNRIATKLYQTIHFVDGVMKEKKKY